MRTLSRQAPWLLVGLGLVGMVWCLSDRYRVRVSLFHLEKLRTRADVEWSPDERPSWHRVDPRPLVEPYAELARQVAGEGTTRERAVRLLKYVSELGGPREESFASPLVDTDDPRDIMRIVTARDFRGNCAHFSKIYHILAHAAGIESRMLGLLAQRWSDGVGHATIEVYLPESKSWMVVDPLYHAYFLDAEGQPLSVLGLRDLLLAGRRDEIRVVQGEIHTGKEEGADLLASYALHIPRVMYPGNNNIIEIHARMYDSWLARAIGLAGWPRQLRRAAENIFWNRDRRYLYVDRPEYDDPLWPHKVFRASQVAVLVGAFWLAARTLRPRRRGREPLGDAISETS